MKKLSIIIILYLLFVILIFNLNKDVIKVYAKKSLIAITNNFKTIVKEDANSSTLTIDQQNFVVINKDFSTKEDVIIKLDAIPFIKAGLSLNNLPTGYKLIDNQLVITTDFGKESGTDFVSSFIKTVDSNRLVLSYHEDLDHFGLALFSSNKIEFAKDYKTNDKDFVFVLDANTFKYKGVDVNSIDGWIFKTMVAKDGTKTDVLLKPYDLKTY